MNDRNPECNCQGCQDQRKIAKKAQLTEQFRIGTENKGSVVGVAESVVYDRSGELARPPDSVTAFMEATDPLIHKAQQDMREYSEHKQMQEQLLVLSAQNSELSEKNEAFHRHNKELQSKINKLELNLVRVGFYNSPIPIDHGHGSEVKCNCGFHQICDACKLTGSSFDTAAPDMVDHPPHYTNHPSGVECIEITRHMCFNLGNVVKYLWRCEEKQNYLEDLKKAAWYLNDEIETIEAERNA